MSINPHFRDHINFRDLGGYLSSDGRKIKHGLLYRSGGLYLMNPEELETLKSLNIKSVLDLRTSEESSAQPDPLLPGVEMIRHSGLTFANGDEIDFSPVGMSKIGEDGYNQLALLKEYYTHIPFNNEAFRIFMSRVANNQVPLLFHCHTGKDRTGVLSIVLLLALGVAGEIVLKDFLLSNEFHKQTIEDALSKDKDRINDHPELGELIQMRTGVTETIGRMVIESISNSYDTLDNYYQIEYGLSPLDLQMIRDKYLE